MIVRFSLAVLALALFGSLTWAIFSLPANPTGLTAKALHHLPASGVMNPVTAALLNYRAYDTLLELGVLLLALVAVWGLRIGEWPDTDQPVRPLLRSMLRLVLPMLVLAAVYLLWIGAFAPGGAFQGGALIGGALVLGLLGGIVGRPSGNSLLWRVGLVAGVVVFIGVAGAAALLTGQLLRYPAGQGGVWILVIEAAALISIGLALGLLYLGGRPEAPVAKNTTAPATNG